MRQNADARLEFDGLLGSEQQLLANTAQDCKTSRLNLCAAGFIVLFVVACAGACCSGALRHHGRNPEKHFEGDSLLRASKEEVAGQACRDWDVRLAGAGGGSSGTPLVYKDGAFRPICMYWFARNHNGAGILCRQLGFSTGTIVRSRDLPGRGPASYGKDAMFVKTCGSGNGSTLESCTLGDTVHRTGSMGVGGCEAGLGDIAVELVCAGDSGRVHSNENCHDPTPDEEYGIPTSFSDGGYGCMDWDVQLSGGDGNSGIPMLYKHGKFHPICSQQFADSPYGARIFCRQMGYTDGVAISLREHPARQSFYAEDAVFVGACQDPNSEKLEMCSTEAGNLGVEACRAQLGGVAVEVTCAGSSSSRTSNPGCMLSEFGTQESTDQKRGCADWDVRLAGEEGRAGGGAQGSPEVFLAGRFRPICGSEFAAGDIGASIFCNQLGYSSGTFLRTKPSQSFQEGVYVGNCSRDAGSLAACGTGAGFACQAGDPVAGRLACYGGHRSPDAAAGCDESKPAQPTTTTTTTVAPVLESMLREERGLGYENINLTRCALVGASSALVGSGAGERIDSYDSVIRINRITSDTFWRDFGKKTDFLFINNIHARVEGVDVMQPGGKPARVSCKELDNCRHAAIVQRGDWRCDEKEMAETWGRNHSLIACVRGNISSIGWSFETLKDFQPSTGFQAFLTFLPLCKEMDLYGFGGNKTADGHGEWEGHALYQEHLIQDIIAAQEWHKLPWSRDPDAAPWMQAHAAVVRKIVGRMP